jgi:quinolinate synthetase complex, A subunit
MPDASQYDYIEAQRLAFGKDLTIVGHHYQDDEVIRHTDLRGDSLELARKTAQVDSKYIMFCGVYFMAESAALLARQGQNVYLPEPSADCSMAMMSPASLLDKIMGILTRKGRKVIPLAYVNSTLGVKAMVGSYGGAVCTSANASTMLTWARGQGDAVLFLPDRNLGNNTADQLGISELDRHVLSLKGQGANIDLAMADRAELLLWPGFCSIHTRFTLRQIDRIRSEYPDARVIVHPECTPEVVKAADAAGSTSFIIRYVTEAPQGSTIVIGTEINLVERLAREHRDRVTVLPLVESACTHMAQTTEERLGNALKALSEGRETFLVQVADDLKAPARASLERMLAACA